MGTVDLQDLQAALMVIRPELILTGTVLLCILADLFTRGKDKTLCWLLAFAGCLTALAATGLSWGKEAEAFAGLVRMDNLSGFFKVIFLLSGLLTLLLSGSYVKREGLPPGEYLSLLLLSLIGMLFMAGASDLITVFLGLEIMSIPVYVLAGFLRGNAKSPEAALKYLLLGAFASAFLLFGIAFVYGTVGTTRLAEVLRHASAARAAADPLFFAGLGFLLVGMGFKVSLVPFHMWTPDVYEGAPTPITAFMSAAVKAAGFAILIRVVVISFQPLLVDWSRIFWVLAVLTMILGNVVALVQENVKRMLAYSSIAHAGYVLVALTPGTQAGVQAALIYMFIYALMNIGAFGVVLSLSRKADQGTEIRDYAGLARKHPLYALAMAVFLFSLAGVPPTGGFIGKFYAFSAAIRSDFVWLAVIGVLMSAVSAYFYLRVLVVMYMQEPEGSEAPLPGPTLAGGGSDMGVVNLALGFCALTVLVLGVWPGWLAQVARQALQGLSLGL